MKAYIVRIRVSPIDPDAIITVIVRAQSENAAAGVAFRQLANAGFAVTVVTFTVDEL